MKEANLHVLHAEHCNLSHAGAVELHNVSVAGLLQDRNLFVYRLQRYFVKLEIEILDGHLSAPARRLVDLRMSRKLVLR